MYVVQITSPAGSFGEGTWACDSRWPTYEGADRRAGEIVAGNGLRFDLVRVIDGAGHVLAGVYTAAD
jgi:hypothetical protein